MKKRLILNYLINFKFLLVGDGPDYDLYQETIKKYGIEDKVIMTGKVEWEKVPLYYHLSDIFLTASHTETQGLTVIEAMASGSVPVCVNDESFQTMVVDGLTGMLFEDKKGCKKIITDLYNDREKLKNMAKQAVINSNRFSSKFFAESVLDVYEKAIENKKKNQSIIEKIVDKMINIEEK